MELGTILYTPRVRNGVRHSPPPPACEMEPDTPRPPCAKWNSVLFSATPRVRNGTISSRKRIEASDLFEEVGEGAIDTADHGVLLFDDILERILLNHERVDKVSGLAVKDERLVNA